MPICFLVRDRMGVEGEMGGNVRGGDDTKIRMYFQQKKKYTKKELYSSDSGTLPLWLNFLFGSLPLLSQHCLSKLFFSYTFQFLSDFLCSAIINNGKSFMTNFINSSSSSYN